MPHHFTKNTVSASLWCNKCGTETEHRIDAGRRGPCLRCLSKLGDPNKQAEVKPAEPQQEELF